MAQVARQRSAGGVVVDRGRVLLIRTMTRSGRSAWTFPKGRIERGEPAWEAALREVREETGYLCRLRRKLRATAYSFRSGSRRVEKTVQWFLLEPLRKAGEPNPREVAEVQWVPLPEAYGRLSYRSDRHLLRMAETALSPDGLG
jgi:8-oxo-dGTP pyrophosphatase MutT (NUDIX family)